MNKLSASAALYKHILERAAVWLEHEFKLPELLTEKAIKDFYFDPPDEIQDCIYDAREDIRSSGIETGIPTDEFSRHYECESVAEQMSDGSWVGWLYWHGGGKHGEPGSIDWIEHAYYLSCEEKEVLTIQRTWTKLKT